MDRKKVISKRGLFILLAVLVIASSVIWGQLRPAPKSTALELTQVTESQSERLQTLCKVWGLAKYYHPALATGKRNWDQELLKLIPQILDAAEGETDALLLAWLESLGSIPVGEPPDVTAITYEDGSDLVRFTDETTLLPETEWQTMLSPALADMLADLSQTYITDRAKGPAFIKRNGTISFDNENPYRVMRLADARLRLLTLFRYWNIIEYFYPYRDIPGENWDDVLAEFIPKFLAAQDELTYKLTVSELIARIHDSHAIVYDDTKVLEKFRGTNYAPVSFLTIDEQVVISEEVKKYADACPLERGDVVKKLDGRDIDEVIAEKLKYISLSNDERIVNGLWGDLFATQNDFLTFTVERNGQTLELQVNCLEHPLADPPASSHQLLDENIGLINPGALQKNEMPSIMESFQDTKGLIVDLRQYPADPDLFSLADFIMPAPAPFARLSYSTPGIPGQFSLSQEFVIGKENPDCYQGKVVLLIDERSQSQAEFATMALRRHATVVGSATIGADGDIIIFSLPGGIKTAISGLGVYYPDGTPTQRVGVAPDIEVFPTVEGLRQGRDELMEKAIELIKAA